MKYRGYTIDVEIDKYASNPREWHNLGVIVGLFNEVDHKTTKAIEKDYAAGKDITNAISEHFGKVVVCIPIYKNFKLINDGKLKGFIFATSARIRYWFDVDDITNDVLDKALKELIKEIDALCSYIKGEVYCFKITELHYLGGDYYTREDCINSAKMVVDQEIGVANEYKRLFETVS